MRLLLGTLGIAVILLGASVVRAESKTIAADAVLAEASYREIGNGEVILDAAVRYRTTEGTELGWRLGFGEYHQVDERVRDRHLTFGPTWTSSALLDGGWLRFDFGFEPWVTMWTPRRKARTETEVTLSYGADLRAMLHVDLDLSKSVRIAPGAGLTARGVRGANGSEPRKKVGDRNLAWRLALPLWLGSRRRIKVEGAYSGPAFSGKHLAQERWDVSLGWAF